MKIEDIADAAFRAIEKALPSALAPIFKAFDALGEQFDAFKAYVETKLGEAKTTPEEVREHVRELLVGFPEIVGEEVKAWLAENPPADGTDGANGIDGKSVTLDDIKGLIESQSAQWHLEFERRAQDTLQRAIEKMPIPRDGKDGRDGRDGKDGKNGTNGVDGLAFDTAEGEFDIERGFVVKLVGGGREAEFVLPYMVHRGFWREGLGVKATQSITHDGALWIAKRDNASKPCLENAEDWQLAARKGRDGRDGKDGKAPPGPVKLGDGNA